MSKFSLLKKSFPHSYKDVIERRKKKRNTHIGKIAKTTNVHLPKKVIFCSVPQLSHSIGLYDHLNDLKNVLHLNCDLHFPHSLN